MFTELKQGTIYFFTLGTYGNCISVTSAIIEMP